MTPQESARILDEAQEAQPLLRTSSGPGLDPDHPDAEKDPERTRTSAIAESLPAFLARMRNAPPPSWLVDELLPDSGLAIWHGRPRSMKSLTAADVILSLALGEPHALNNARFKIPTATGSLVLAEEDSERLYGFRLGSMLTARGILPGHEPDTFRLVVRPGWNLETSHGQAELLAVIRETSVAMTTPLVVLVIDPARASMPGIDGGPLDASKARAFLFSILRETTIKVILLVHHDTKPRSDGKDDRARAERASGGVTFSIGDAMIGFERINDRECLAVPSSYKAGADPRPFKVRFESETQSGEAFRGFIRATAEAVDEASSLRKRVLDFVRANPWSSTSDVDKGVHVRAGGSGQYLAQLEAAGVVVRETGPQAKARGKAHNAVLWGCP